MSPLKHSKSFAARMGRWSASHWKTAVSLWLAFVVASVLVGAMVGTQVIKQTDTHVGESRTADQIISDAGFTVDKKGESIKEQTEMVLLQSKTLTTDDPAFKAAIADSIKTVSAFPQVSKLRSPLDPEQAGLISKDHHSALVQFTPEGSYTDVILYIDKIAAAVDEVQTRHAGLTIEPVGASTEKKLDAVIQSGLGKVGLISIPLTILVLMLVLGSLTAAMVPLLTALTAIAATSGLVAIASQIVPADENIMEVILLVGLAVGVDYSPLLHQARARRACRRSQRRCRSRGRRRHLRPGDPRLGHHRHDRDGRHVPLRRQDVHVLLGRDDAGRPGRDDRLPHRPAGRALEARRPDREGPDSVRPPPPPLEPRRRHVERDPRPRPPAPARLGARRDGGAPHAGGARAPAAHCRDRHRGHQHAGRRAVRPRHGRVPGHPGAGRGRDQGG